MAMTRLGRGKRRVTPATSWNLGSRTDFRELWAILGVMLVGRFMILVDATIVAVATPTIMAALNTSYDMVIWVTSAYLLAFAVPLLVAGRLGDRFGQKNVFVFGLSVFTAASAWCGLSGSVGMLIAARAVQGIGAALLAPQILSTVTHLCPPQHRGAAMSLWGVTAGFANLIGPLASGVLVYALGWEWIFFINVPIGIVGLALAVWLIPVMPTQRHRFDLVGVSLSAMGIFLIVFGLQQGQPAGWQPWIWVVIVAGVGLMSAFVYWQSINAREPLVPLRVFGDRDFTMSTLGVAAITFTMTAMTLPVMFYAQAVCGLSPIRAAMLTASMALVSALLAPMVGKIIDRSRPRPVIGSGFSMLAIGLMWLSIEMSSTTPMWRLMAPFIFMGVGVAFVWSPLAATATRKLPAELAGASSGVYEASRQLGAVLGSASMAALMTWRISTEMPTLPGGVLPTAAPGRTGAAVLLPEYLRAPFSTATAQTMWLPTLVAVFGIAAALFMVGFTAAEARGVAEHSGRFRRAS
ncbi:Multidrug resistance protein B [Mycobacterium basiliense]|uniref:Multidrug resistance protein B n=1 Tax=Mycobacterium basiliense TaxID=2094119 RepID=A0A3S4DUP6_9MYCO|nr:Multidrug resistance protein B [Mycobacterium basiliense]